MEQEKVDEKAVAPTSQSEGWMDWWSNTYGTPNDWLDASPTAKGWQKSANEFFKGVGNWGYETGKVWFPDMYEPGIKGKNAQEKEEQASENAPDEEVAI